jgi:hypothetical protein
MEALQISNTKKILKKGGPFGMSQFKWFNLKSQIKNKIGCSYVGVGLIKAA